MPKLTPQDFIHRWQRSELNERAAYQTHFLDLCSLIGHPGPVELDPRGTFFRFEAGATKTGGGEGFADVWYRGHFAWEYKGKHADLDKAYRQLLQYREALENPPLLIVSDISSIYIHTNFTNSVKRTFALPIEDLATAAGLDLLRRIFTDPDSFRPGDTSEAVTRKAAEKFALLSDRLRQQGQPPEAAAHFLIRLLFCLFAEDTGLLPGHIFTRLVQNFRNRPQSFNAQLAQLFAAMSTGGGFGVEAVPWFDGRLFDDAAILELDAEGLSILLEVSTLDWSAVEPAIFGVLFERSLDPARRSQLGAHYTGKDDILLITEPVLMAPLRREWAALKMELEPLVGKRDASRGATRHKLDAGLQKRIQQFSDRLAEIRVLDPACGSGNFLYVALRQLLDLQKEVRQYAFETGINPAFHSVSPAQLHGIEISDYAQQLAQATIQIGYIQWLSENGLGLPEEPILQPLDTIRRMDAILAFDENGEPLEPEWPEVDVIIGNPPFLGGKKLRTELGDQYVEVLFTLYSDRVSREADLVVYWFEKARAQIEQGKAKRAGLLATQGIRGGANRQVLDRIKNSGGIFWAYSDRDWILDGANVHVSIVGFDDCSDQSRLLDGQPVQSINSNLTSDVDVTKAVRLSENAEISFMGDIKVGPFDIPDEMAKKLLAAPTNPNGKSNQDVIRPWVNGLDITRRNRNMWIIDFGVDMSEEAAALYEAPYEYVKKYVLPMRIGNRMKNREEKWWIHGDSAPRIREAFSNIQRYVATPRVSKYRLFVWLEKKVLPDCQLIVFARDDDYFFGVLHSRPHELWARALGTQLREASSGFRYTPTTTFETFPFPWPPGREDQQRPQVQAIAAAAAELVRLRDAWLNPPGATAAELKKRTLTNLYNQRPTWLQLAHRKLDETVFAAYGWPPDLSDEQILERLLALNLQRAAAP